MRAFTACSTVVIWSRVFVMLTVAILFALPKPAIKKPAARRRRVAWSQTGSKGVQAARMNGRPSSSDVLSCLEIDRLRAARVLLDLEAHFLPLGQMT